MAIDHTECCRDFASRGINRRQVIQGLGITATAALPDLKPYVAHFAPSVGDYNQAAVKADLERRGYKPEPDTKYGWSIQDPAGMRIEVAGKGLPEHIGGDCNGVNGGCPGGPDK
jgi:hypothetical protein